MPPNVSVPPLITSANIAPAFIDIPSLSHLPIISPFSFRMCILPEPLSFPPSVNVPPFIRSAYMVPAVIKSATRFPSIVHAFSYGPFIPFVLNPTPFLFNWITFLARVLSILSIIKIRSGYPLLSPSSNTYPPFAPVINSVALSIAFCICLLIFVRMDCTSLLISLIRDVFMDVLVGGVAPRVYTLLDGFSKSIFISVNNISVFMP